MSGSNGEACGFGPAEFGPALARHATDALLVSLPDDVREKAKLHLLDTIAAIISGAALEAGIAGRRYATSLGGLAVAPILGTGIRAPLLEAALANGMAAHADESDDSQEDSQTHPGCGVVPAAIVVGTALGCSGEAVLRATVLGYEMTVRFARAFGSAMTFKRSSMSSHAYGPLFGAGYAAGALMGFDAGRFMILLNYLAQEASGLTTWRLDERHTLKSYVFGGMPAMNGVKSAALVRAGFTGSGDVLDMGERNMLDAISPQPRPDALTERLGDCFAVMETDIKRYPVGYPIAAPVAALESIIAGQQIAASEVQSIRIRYHEDWYKVIGDKSRMPDVNLRYCMAVTMLDGRLRFDAAHDSSRMKSPDVLHLGERIAMLGPTPGLERFAAVVEVDARGRTFRHEQGRNVRGRAENPMTRDEVEAKAAELMGTVLPPTQIRAAIPMLRRVEEVANCSELVALLTT